MKSLVKTATRGEQIRQWLPISLILLLAATLYFYQLGTEGFWIDELTSVTDIQTGRGLPPRNLVRPLYYILLSIWMRFSNSDAWLRGLSVLFALVSVFLVYRLGRRLAGEPEGLIAALLLTLSPLFINHAQEVRMYAMSTCLGLGGTLAIANALTTKKQPSYASIAWWAGLRLLSILTVPLNVTLLVPDAILVGWRFRHQRRALLRFGTGFVLIGVLWAPLGFSVVRFATSSSGGYAGASHVTGRHIPNLVDVVRTLKFYTVWPFSVQSNAIAAWFYKAFTGLLAGLIGVALIHKQRAKLFWAAAWAFLPLAQIFLFSQVSTSLWVSRYLLFVCPYIFILVGAGCMRVWRQWRIAAIAVAFAYALAIAGGLVRYYTVQDRPNYREVVQTIARYEQPGDVVVWSMYYQKALAHYYDGSATVVWNPLFKPEDTTKLEEWLSRLPKTESRLWIASQVSERGSQALQAELQQRFRVLKHNTVAGRTGGNRDMEVFLVAPRLEVRSP